MNNKHGVLAMAVCTALGVDLGMNGGALAASYSATLAGTTSYSTNGSTAANLTSSTATWAYDDTADLLTQTGGTFDARYTIVPVTTLFRHSITGLVVGAGTPADAGSFTCTEGNFGAVVSASICGNYQFRANGMDDSTVTWGPGTAFDRTIGGDDMALGPQQSLLAYDGMARQSLAAGTLVMSNAICISTPTVDCNDFPGFLNAGYDMTLSLSGAGEDAATTAFNTPTSPLDVLANDFGLTDPVTLDVTVPPDHGGTVQITNGGSDCLAPCTGAMADLRVILTPSAVPGTATYNETFTYETTDGAGTQSAMVTVTVVNDMPDPGPDPDTGLRQGGGSSLDPVLVLLFGAGLLGRRRLPIPPFHCSGGPAFHSG